MATFHELAANLESMSKKYEDFEDLSISIHNIVETLYDEKGYNSADDVRNLLSLAAFRDVEGICELLRAHDENEEF